MEPHPTLATLRKLEEQLHQLKLNYSALRELLSQTLRVGGD